MRPTQILFVISLCVPLAGCIRAGEGIVVLRYATAHCPEPLFPAGFPDPEKVGFKVEQPEKPSIFGCHDAEFFRIWTDRTVFGYQYANSIAVKAERSKSGCDLYVGSGFFVEYCEEKTDKGCADRISKARERADTFVREALRANGQKAKMPPGHIVTLFSTESIRDFCSRPVSGWSSAPGKQ